MHDKPDRRAFVCLQGATFVSWLGDGMSNLALPWFVLQVTGSPALTGAAAISRTIGSYLASVLTGPYIDKFPGKRISVLCDFVASAAALAIPISFAVDRLDVWHIFLYSFMVSILQRPASLARNRSLPEVAQHSGVSLERATGLNEVFYQSTLFVGPAMAGLLVSVVGTSWVLVLNAVSFLVSAGLINYGVPGFTMGTGSDKDATTNWSYGAKLREGFAFIRQDRLLLPMVATVSFGIMLVDTPLLAVILPVHMRANDGSAVALGLLVSCFAGGALLGASIYTTLGQRLPARRVWIGCYSLIFLPYIVISLSLPLELLALAMALFGLAEGLSTPIFATIRFQRVPQDIRGRVFGSLSPITGLAPSIGLLITGVLITPIGISGISIVLVAGGILLCWWLVTGSSFRLMDDSQAERTART